MSFRFPDGFVWGTATAAHQVEGNNVNADFWLLEHTDGTIFTEPSGDACDSFHRYPEDIRLLRQLGFGSYRFSIEWARIEPDEGWFSAAALDHYRRMLATCHEQGVRPCVSFHHFTSPRWFTADGGWEDIANVDRFLRFCERAVMHLGDLIDTAYTINEANLMATLYSAGILPRAGMKARMPFVAEAARRCGSTLDRFGPFMLGHPLRVTEVLLDAHVRSREVLKAGRGNFPVGVTLAMPDYQAVPGGEARRDEARKLGFDAFLEAARADDFVGVQTYSRHRFGPHGSLHAEDGVPRRWLRVLAEALEATIATRRTRQGAGVRHRERHRHDRRREQRRTTRRAPPASIAACATVSTCAATSLVADGQLEWLSAMGRSSGQRRRSRHVMRCPKPSAEWSASRAPTRPRIDRALRARQPRAGPERARTAARPASPSDAAGAR
jgi:beta-glucosidase